MFSALGLLLWPWFRDPQLCQLAANQRCALYFWGRVAMATRSWGQPFVVQPTEQGSARQKRPLLGTAILGRGGILSSTTAPPSTVRDVHFMELESEHRHPLPLRNKPVTARPVGIAQPWRPPRKLGFPARCTSHHET